MIAAAGRELYYHTWEKEGSTHYYEVDFLISDKSKIIAETVCQDIRICGSIL